MIILIMVLWNIFKLFHSPIYLIFKKPFIKDTEFHNKGPFQYSSILFAISKVVWSQAGSNR